MGSRIEAESITSIVPQFFSTFSLSSLGQLPLLGVIITLMRLSTLLSCTVLAAAATLSAQSNLLNYGFEDGATNAAPQDWNTAVSPLTNNYRVRTQSGAFNPPNLSAVTLGFITLAPAVTTPAFPAPTEGSNAAYIYRQSGGAVSTGFGVLAQSFTLPIDGHFTRARIEFDMAYSSNISTFTDPNALIPGNFIRVGIYEGVLGSGSDLETIFASLTELAIIFETQPGDATNSSGYFTFPSFDLASIFNQYLGQEVTLAFMVSNNDLTGNRYLNVAIDNVVLLVNEPSGGGSGTAATAANANRTQETQQLRNRQRQFQAHQARVARDQRLAAARRAAQR